ncbi:hypothetical protein WX45_01817 [Clostridium ljungdahlii DSM 13528]|uniref:Uncharacterized protein n=2 Tax=Clostridium ljungdahlii TaxID=1538 RepID=D8GQ63_CLOLD|nr:hypothetical protein [Clostridium ljungdahlii]ADK16154.1 hypothetical protein CLJU_c31060 [Clostridium ljungdahlii DSM 13528]OAA89978.1 hypothetical protein WX45_01817 [Clostridium ljungdahlii DSM 13528]
MKKFKNTFIILLILIICFCLSSFGMYEYSNYKNNITMQKEKALAAAQNIQKEKAKNDEINKDIELASNSAKDSKYDDANKYLDEALKLDPNNSEAKNLKDSYSKIIEQQKQQANIQAQAQTQNQQNRVSSSNDNTKFTYNEALNLLKEQYPGCSFTEVNDSDGLNLIKHLRIQDKKIYVNCYFFYGHDDKEDYDLEGMFAVSEGERHIYSIITGYGSTLSIHLIK